jgi:hypothetical protein
VNTTVTENTETENADIVSASAVNAVTVNTGTDNAAHYKAHNIDGVGRLWQVFAAAVNARQVPHILTPK